MLVHRAALELVTETEFTRISRREIALRAGVSRQTLYNRWHSVGDIVLEALLERGEREVGITAAPSGDPLRQLHSYLNSLAEAVDGWARPGLKAVAALAQQDAAFATRFQQQLLAPRHQRLLDVVLAACEHDPTCDAVRIAELIAASMWYRLLVSNEALDSAWVEMMVDVTKATTTQATVTQT